MIKLTHHCVPGESFVLSPAELEFVERYKESLRRIGFQRSQNEVTRARSKRHSSSPHMLALRSADAMLQPGAVSSVLSDIRKRIAAIKEDYNFNLYTELMRLRDVATILNENADAWLEFCRDDYWKKKAQRDRPRLNSPQDALRFVILRLCSTIKNKRKRKNRVNTYYSALRELDARCVPIAGTVKAMDDARGLSGLGRAWAARQAALQAEAGLSIEKKENRATVSKKDVLTSGSGLSGPKSGNSTNPVEPLRTPEAKRKTKPDATERTEARSYVGVLLRKSNIVRHLLKKGRGYRREAIVVIEGIQDGKPMLSLKKRE